MLTGSHDFQKKTLLLNRDIKVIVERMNSFMLTHLRECPDLASSFRIWTADAI